MAISFSSVIARSNSDAAISRLPVIAIPAGHKGAQRRGNLRRRHKPGRLLRYARNDGGPLRHCDTRGHKGAQRRGNPPAPRHCEERQRRGNLPAPRHCEERSDAAISGEDTSPGDCFATLVW